MSGLGAVDWVVDSDEDTPEHLLGGKTDVLVKGGDYRDEQVVGGDIVREYGGSVKVLTLVEDLSTRNWTGLRQLTVVAQIAISLR